MVGDCVDVLCIFLNTNMSNVFMYLYDIIIRLLRDGWKSFWLFRVVSAFLGFAALPWTRPDPLVLGFWGFGIMLVVRGYDYVPSHIHY